MAPSVPEGQTSGPVTIQFECDDEDLTVIDTVERRRYSLSLSGATAPSRIGTEPLRFPVDSAVSVETDSITLPTVIATYLRDEAGRMLAEPGQFDHRSFPSGTYSVELCAPMKLYLRVESAFEITADAVEMRIDFPEPTAVAVGARSKHDRPAATVTTTDEPEDVMKAISTFGSALKTTSPERSYPTLRGHPPTIERGPELSIPDGLSSPETGVTIGIPPTLRHAYVVAPLAYYLGANVEPDDEPEISADSGYSYSLGSDGRFERAVEQVLKQTFFLDCITRTEGLYPIDLHERQQIERHVDLDFEALYGQSITARLEAYLSVPYSAIEAHIPEWKLTSHVAATPESIEMLPFLVNDLAIVRTPSSGGVATAGIGSTAVEGFLRSSFTRSTREAAAAAPAQAKSFVEPSRAGSLEQTWVGSETPMGASKATPQAYRNRLDRDRSMGDISIAVVCNDTEMDEERDLVDDVYGSREELPFDVSAHRNLTREELRSVLERDLDYLHYIGHIEPDGFECVDGRLDATGLEEVGIDAFLLNGCRSYDQGMALIDGGAIGGIVTLTDVINAGAVKIGSALARLLNTGFPLRAALEVAKDEDVMGEQYIVVGDGGMSVTQSEGNISIICDIARHNGGFIVKFIGYSTDAEGMGSIVYPRVAGNQNYYLNSGEVGVFELSRDELHEFLQKEDVIGQISRELFWTSDSILDELF